MGGEDCLLIGRGGQSSCQIEIGVCRYRNSYRISLIETGCSNFLIRYQHRHHKPIFCLLPLPYNAKRYGHLSPDRTTRDLSSK
jgi:hypothetical protein